MIKVIKAKDIEIEDVELEDDSINLSKEDGPNGEHLDYNKNLYVTYKVGDVYKESNDNSFNPTRMYYVKTGRTAKKVSPVILGLYERNNGITAKSRDKEFEDKDYFVDEYGQELATPKNLNLLEKDTAKSTDNRYILWFKPNIGSAFVVKSFSIRSSENAWEYVKTSYERAVNMVDELNETFNLTEGDLKTKQEAVKEEILGKRQKEVSKYNREVSRKREKVGATNSLDVTALRTAVDKANENYKEYMSEVIENALHMKFEDYIKAVADGTISKHDIEKRQIFKDFINREIKYINGKYRVTVPKVDGKYMLKRKSANSKTRLDKVWFKNIDELLKGIARMEKVADVLRNNIANGELPKSQVVEALNIASEEVLPDLHAVGYEEVQENLTPEEMPSTETNDSYEYITYEIRDNKKFITGYYKTLEDAQDAEYGQKLVKIYPGVYKDETKDKYIAMPISPDKKKYKLGEFNTLEEAKAATIFFIRFNYDVNKFFNPQAPKEGENDTYFKFYSNHLDELQEAKERYIQEETNVVNREGKYGIAQGRSKDGKFRLWYYDPELKRNVYIFVGGEFSKEADVERYLQEADNYPEGYVKYFQELQKELDNSVNLYGKNLKEIVKEGSKKNYLTSTDVTKKIRDLSIDDLPYEEVDKLLSGEFAKTAGQTFIFKNVVNYIKKELGINIKEQDYNDVTIVQNNLLDMLIDYVIEDFDTYINSTNQYFETEKDFIDKGIDFFGENHLSGQFDKAAFVGAKNRYKKALKDLYKQYQ